MDHTSIASQTQADICIHGKIDAFFNRFRMGTLLQRNGIRKRNGHSPRILLQSIFDLPFIGHNFFRGIVLNNALPFGKDAAYQLLKGTRYNWRRLLLDLGRRLFVFFVLRYMFLSFECRLSADQRTFGDLFYACCEEMRDLTYMESLMRILNLALDQLQKLRSFCEKTCQAIFFAVVEAAVDCIDLRRHRSIVFAMNPES